MAKRPDLERRHLAGLLGLVLVFSLAVLVLGRAAAPGFPWRQSAAALGTLLLFVPFGFSLLKRSRSAANPPAWFVAHVLASMLGTVLVLWHAAAGSFFSPPGVLLLGLAFLLVQGVWARAVWSQGISELFGSKALDFLHLDAGQRERLRAIIRRKVTLLRRLDPQASEALFSPTLGHWFRHPLSSMRYVGLAAAESRILATRSRAGPILGYWRRIHIAVAYLFVAGVVIHVLTVMFFAGYAAGGDPIYWWHVSAWGGGE